MTTPTPADRRAVAEIVLPEKIVFHDIRAALEGGYLHSRDERIVLEDGLLRARIASHFGTCSSGFYARCGEEHALDTIFTGDTMLDALWACALAHVREVERRRMEEISNWLADPGYRAHSCATLEKQIAGSLDRIRRARGDISREESNVALMRDSIAAIRKIEVEPPPPEPRRFFPGERVTVCGTSGSVLLVRGVEVVVLIDRNGVSFALTHENPNLAPETAARVIPYGDTRCPR